MKKLIFCDIDGTIIDGSRNMSELSDRTRYAISELARENYVFIASGRCKGLLDQQIIDLKPNGFILCNGAYGEFEGKEIYSYAFDDNAVSRIRELTERLDGFCIMETLEDMYVDSLENPAFIDFMKRWGKEAEGFRTIENENRRYLISMIGFLNSEMTETVTEGLSEYADVAPHYHHRSFDINVKGINKGTGVLKIREYLNIPYEDTYCFGDGINDIEMLQSVGHPVIMKNAHPDLKKYGFAETDDVLEDGFYNYLLANKLIKPM